MPAISPKDVASPLLPGLREQVRRLEERRRDPLKQWKSSPIDAVAVKHWKAYSAARDAMMRDYKVAMVSDANGARYDEDHLAGLTSFFQSFGDVRTTDEVINELLAPVKANAAAE